ncbi:MAG: tetratricopeptide repeat protein [archaeon]|nr:MAG: tetratricopeptide repeat protein [archaeon]
MTEAARGAHISPRNMYGETGGLGSFVRALIREGSLEARVFPKERGRGGLVSKLRVAYDRKPVQAFVDSLALGKTLRRQSGGLDRTKIAVLPFASMSRNPSDADFADGVCEELISRLSIVSGLSVISRTSTLAYRATDKTAPEIGSELSAGSIIEGSVRKSGNRIRVTIQLIDANTDGHVWAQSYDRELGDIFEIQSDVSEKVTEFLKVKLLPSESQRMGTPPTSSTKALALYLKGRHYWGERTEAGFEKAIAYFEKAVEADPNYALAYSGLANCFYFRAAYGFAERKAASKRAREMVLRAIELDPDLAEAHASLGWVIYHEIDWNWRDAQTELESAVRLKPSFSSAHQWLSILLSENGVHDRAIDEAKKALELDPFSNAMQTTLAQAYWMAHREREGIEVLERAAAASPEFSSFYNYHAYLGLLRVSLGLYREGVKEMQTAVRLSHGQPVLKADLGYALGKAGKRVEALRILHELESGKRGLVTTLNLAEVHLGLGNFDKCLGLLEAALKQRVPDFRTQVAGPIFGELSESSRLKRILELLEVPH